MSGRIKNNNLSLITGCVCASIQAIVIFTSGNPYTVAHNVSSFGFIPPLWIWCLTLIIDSFLLGYAFGGVFLESFSGKRRREAEIRVYQGGMFFIAAYLLSLAHYPLFFIHQKFVTSCIIAIFALLFSLVCVFFWHRVSIVSCAVMIIHSAWIGYIFFANGYLIFNI